MVRSFDLTEVRKELGRCRSELTSGLASLDPTDESRAGVVMQYQVVTQLQELIQKREDFVISDLLALRPKDTTRNKGERQVENARAKFIECIYKEFGRALCSKDMRYQEYTNEFKKNWKLLAAGVGGYVAAELGIQEAVVSVIAASLLLLISAVGVNAFCNYLEKADLL